MVLTMIFCPECGTQNTDQIAFCLNCGKSITASIPNSIADIPRIEQSRSNKFSALLKSRKRPVIAIGFSGGAMILVLAGIFIASTGVAQPLIGQRWDKTQLAIETFSAQEEGFASGKEEGFTSGQADGYKSGKDEGYTTGKSDGYASGYTTGKSDGYTDGYDTGNSEGYSSGKADGYSSGKADGYSSGYSEGQTYGYTNGYNAGKTAGYESGRTAGYSSGYYNGCALVFSRVGGTSFRINNYTYFRSSICGS